MSFNKEKHIKFWRMCSKVLPDHYIPSDGSRVFLGYTIVAAFDVLGALDTVKPEERQAWVSWLYSCQVKTGGFRGFTGTNFGELGSSINAHWDPANLPATFFALATLLTLGDDLSRLGREECLQWLPQLQRDDGSFGEVLSFAGRIEGGRDLRYCCCAAGIAYMLQDPSTQPYQAVFNEEKLITYIQSCQNYNGGFSESPLREPHSGLNYCAIAALALLTKMNSAHHKSLLDLIPDAAGCIRWMLERQTIILTDEEDEDEAGEEQKCLTTDDEVSPIYVDPCRIAGFNGRDNKVADTCYCFWNSGALALLQSEELVNSEAVRRYLLEKTQHMIGGFSKAPGHPPDVLHSYLGLAALSIYREPGIKRIDPTLCISEEAACNLSRTPWRRQGD